MPESIRITFLQVILLLLDVENLVKVLIETETLV
jgi:hypothetical protein